MTQLSEIQLRQKFRKLFFKAAGGVSDLANDEVSEAMMLCCQYAEEREAALLERIGAKFKDIDTDLARLTSPLPNTEKEE